MRWIVSSRVVWAALALGLALSLPSLAAGRFADDFAQLMAVERAPPRFANVLSQLDLFRMMDGTPERTQAIMDHGLAPWWTLPELRVAFWRPLSSALMTLDRVLFGRGTIGPHAHSILWSLALVGAVCLLFRRLFPTALGGLAMLLFVLDDARVLPTLWLASRNALVAATFGVVGLSLHVRAREEGLAPLSFASVACFLVALLAGEVALGAVAYLGAYELASGPGRLPRRLRALLPVGAVCAIWFVAYRLLGYGSGGGLYVDPTRDPAEWAGALLSRFPALVGSMLLGAPADAWLVGEKARLPLVGAGLLAIALFGWLLRSAWPQMTGEERRHTRWLLLGSALSILPVASTLPSSRLLLVPGIGGAAAIAVALRHLWSRRPSIVRRERELRAADRALLVPRLAVAVLLVLVHVVGAAALWPWAAYAMRASSSRGDAANETIAAALRREHPDRPTLVMLWVEPSSLFEMPARWGLDPRASPGMPRAWRILSATSGDHLYTRTGPGTLELELAGGRLLSTGAEQAFRKRSRRLRPGDRVTLDGMRVDVLAADEAGIRQVRFTFDVPLDDPSLIFFGWEDGALRRVRPPPVGARWVVGPAPNPI